MKILNQYTLTLLVSSTILLQSCNTIPQLDVNYRPGELNPPDEIKEEQQEKKTNSAVTLISFGNDDDSELFSLKTAADFEEQHPTFNWESFTGDPLPSAETDIEEITDRRWTPISFAYNRSSLGETERKKLEKLADYLSRNEQYQLIIEGHCDERGSEEYNRVLGEKRAIAVRDYLVNLNISGSRIRTISYGEEKPLDIGVSEISYAKNRRAEFIVGIELN